MNKAAIVLAVEQIAHPSSYFGRDTVVVPLDSLERILNRLEELESPAEARPQITNFTRTKGGGLLKP